KAADFANRAENSLFAGILKSHQDRDFLLVRAGVLIPELADLRLAWTAHRQTGVATVSPICDHPDDHERFAPWQDTANEDLLAHVAKVDRICLQASRFHDPDTDRVEASCVYVRCDAAKMVLQRWEGNAGLTFTSFVQAARRLRYAHVLADHVYVAGVLPRDHRPEWSGRLGEDGERSTSNSLSSLAAAGTQGRHQLPAANARPSP